MNLVKIILVVTLFFSLSANAQDLTYKQIPNEVHQEFAKLYPDMFAYEWEYKKKEGVYRAQFIDNGQEFEAYFMPDGRWVKTEGEIKKEKLPQDIWKSLSESNYQNWKVDDIDLLQTPKFPVLYKLEMKNGKQKIYLYFLPNGTEVKLD